MSCSRLYSVDILVECGKLELGVGLVFVFQLLWVESSDGSTDSESKNE